MNRPVRESADFINGRENMGRLLKILACFIFIFIASACGISDKESYLESFESFIIEIEQRKQLTPNEITSIKKDYLDFSETYYNKYELELSQADKEMILELKTRYYTALAKQGMKDFGESLKELGEQASEFINDILE